MDGDARSEILTGPGPSAAFAPQLRGFDYIGTAVMAIARVNAQVFAGARYGLNVSAGDIDGDGYDEIACGAGPDPGFGSRLSCWDYDGATLAPIQSLVRDAFGLSYGTRVATAELSY